MHAWRAGPSATHPALACTRRHRAAAVPQRRRHAGWLVAERLRDARGARRAAMAEKEEEINEQLEELRCEAADCED